MFIFITHIVAAIFAAALVGVIVNKIVNKWQARPIVETDEGPHLYISKDVD